MPRRLDIVVLCLVFCMFLVCLLYLQNTLYSLLLLSYIYININVVNSTEIPIINRKIIGPQGKSLSIVFSVFILPCREIRCRHPMHPLRMFCTRLFLFQDEYR